MTNRDLDTMAAAFEDVVTDAENLIESLTEAAATTNEATAERMNGWRVPIEALRNDARRIVGSVRGRQEEE